MIALALFTGPVNGAQTSARDEAVKVARKELGNKLVVAPDTLQLISASPAEWPDSSLGCPDRDQIYAPVMTSGFKVTFRHADRDHVVHVAGNRAVICEPPPGGKMSSPSVIAASLKAGDAVRRAASTELKVDPSRVRVTSTLPWKPSEQVCANAPARANGLAYLVEASVDGKPYRYYADDVATVRCVAK